ncbi:hypothetical protein HYPSUDRAFT_204687 [Hypholoma sublateritium FD-334 SS-4]|uniref:Uncharacterized protein n=1 Tax=Hypholoma sublateritium (strain FD-334 SS-4) TaxID=945553 RepID=A0A0D2PGR4_HYPSF|nr:hypothetical protein HYPSUDRAFT_204687 [Hypholoma sublateritium FD-334 SS-4]
MSSSSPRENSLPSLEQSTTLTTSPGVRRRKYYHLGEQTRDLQFPSASLGDGTGIETLCLKRLFFHLTCLLRRNKSWEFPSAKRHPRTTNDDLHGELESVVQRYRDGRSTKLQAWSQLVKGIESHTGVEEAVKENTLAMYFAEVDSAVSVL